MEEMHFYTFLRLLKHGDNMINVLSFLQSNAEWMSAIGLVVFAAVQVWLMHAQNRQQIRLKRLDLAHEMDVVCAEFDGEKISAIKVQEWFVRNQSLFTFLLNRKDVKSVEAAFAFLSNVRQHLIIPTEEAINNIKQFDSIINNVSCALGCAHYGIVSDNVKKPKEDKNAK